MGWPCCCDGGYSTEGCICCTGAYSTATATVTGFTDIYCNVASQVNSSVIHDLSGPESVTCTYDESKAITGFSVPTSSVAGGCGCCDAGVYGDNIAPNIGYRLSFEKDNFTSCTSTVFTYEIFVPVYNEIFLFGFGNFKLCSPCGQGGTFLGVNAIYRGSVTVPSTTCNTIDVDISLEFVDDQFPDTSTCTLCGKPLDESSANVNIVIS